MLVADGFGEGVMMITDGTAVTLGAGLGVSLALDAGDADAGGDAELDGSGDSDGDGDGDGNDDGEFVGRGLAADTRSGVGSGVNVGAGVAGSVPRPKTFTRMPPSSNPAKTTSTSNGKRGMPPRLGSSGSRRRLRYAPTRAYNRAATPSTNGWGRASIWAGCSSAKSAIDSRSNPGFSNA